MNIHKIKKYLLAFTIVLVAIFSCSNVLAQRGLVYTPSKDAVLVPHPLYGDHPGAAKDAYFSKQESDKYAIFYRIVGAIQNGGEGVTTITLEIKNLSTSEAVVIKPTLDLVDGGGKVLHVMDYQAMHNSLVESAAVGTSQQSSFFAMGNQQFVGSALGGYAIGSLFRELAATSKRGVMSKMALLMETHWLKDEYRLPPQAHIDGLVWLKGLPSLPLTSIIKIDGQVFSFVSVATEQEAELNAIRKPN